MSMFVLDDVGKRRGDDLHKRIPTARLPGLGHTSEDPHVIHGEHKAEYVEFRKAVNEHVKGGSNSASAYFGVLTLV